LQFSSGAVAGYQVATCRDRSKAFVC